MTSSKRYSGPATTKWYYRKEYLVVCPKCKQSAIVTPASWHCTSGVLKCHNCFYTEKTEEKIYYEIIAKRNCSNCGKSINTVIPQSTTKVGMMAVTCKHCGITEDMRPKNNAYRITYHHNTEARDPLFNLPLWFKTSVKEHLFWAYNREHLLEIKNYVGAALRERQTSRFSTMVEKLPSFIKQAKNREVIIKAITRLEKKSGIYP